MNLLATLHRPDICHLGNRINTNWCLRVTNTLVSIAKTWKTSFFPQTYDFIYYLSVCYEESHQCFHALIFLHQICKVTSKDSYLTSSMTN